MSTTMTAEEFQHHLATKGKNRRSKYGVAPKEERTWRGKTYASKTEMEYAQHLANDITTIEVVEQPRVRLGEDHIYVPDFLVIDGQSEGAFYVDVKGVETPTFKKTRKLWAKYGRLPLHIVTRKGRAWETEVVEGVVR